MKLRFQYNDKTYENFTPEQALLAGVPQSVIDDATAIHAAEQNKLIKRGQINMSVGDAGTLIGTATDAVHIALYAIAHIIKGINDATDIDDLKTSIQPFTDLADDFINSLASETLKLPFQTKGLEVVTNEIKQRATTTSQILTPQGE